MGRIFSPLLVLMALTLSPGKAQERYFADPNLKAAVQEAVSSRRNMSWADTDKSIMRAS